MYVNVREPIFDWCMKTDQLSDCMQKKEYYFIFKIFKYEDYIITKWWVWAQGKIRNKRVNNNE